MAEMGQENDISLGHDSPSFKGWKYRTIAFAVSARVADD